MKFHLSLGSLLLTLFFAVWSTPSAAQDSVIIFVNGANNCCADEMALYNSAERLGDLIFDFGWELRTTAWNSFKTRTNADQASATSTFIRQASEYLNGLKPGTNVYLIGHSFGADSLLKLMTEYRRSEINFRLLAAIDPVSTGGLRTKLDDFHVPRSVEYFYNIWQENDAFPFDFRSDGAIKCDALTCNQRSNNYHRNADGSEVRKNCSWIEIGCNDRRENPLNARPGWKKKRTGHQSLQIDAYVLNEVRSILTNLKGHTHPNAGAQVVIPPPPTVKILSGPTSFSIPVKPSKTETTTVYDSVARFFSGGKGPFRFELLEKPQAFAYFSFDPETGIFIFRPTSTYGVESFKFSIEDSVEQKIVSQATISFDRSDIFPGRPALTQMPDRPLPAAINPLMTITSDQSNESRRMERPGAEAAELLTVRGGNLSIDAEAFLENLDDSYAGVLDCTVDWNGRSGIPVAIRDNDDFAKNYFVQEKIPASNLQPYEVTIFRMTCMAPDMPIAVMDIPVVYVPNAEGIKQAFDKVSYSYVSSQGETLNLSLDSGASSSAARTYKYTLKSMECGQMNGTLVAQNSQNKLTINGSFEGVLADGSSQRMVWLNAPVCDKTSPIIWKLQTSDGSGSSGGSGNMSSFCQYKHKKDTAGGKNGDLTSLDGAGKNKSCDKNGDWKTMCKDGNGDTDEVGCDAKIVAPPSGNLMCQYKHKKDTAGGKNGQTTSLDGSGKGKSCDKNGDWKTVCKDGNGDTDEVGCDKKIETPPAASMCQYKHKKDTAGGKNGQTNGLDGSGKSKSCDKNGDWKTACKDGNGDTDEVSCQ